MTKGERELPVTCLVTDAEDGRLQLTITPELQGRRISIVYTTDLGYDTTDEDAAWESALLREIPGIIRSSINAAATGQVETLGDLDFLLGEGEDD